MLILFDHVTPDGIAFSCWPYNHESERPGWDRLSNGDLLTVAEEAGFDVLLTADKNIRYQNLEGRRIALVVLSTPRWPVGELHVGKIVAAVTAATPGSYFEVELPEAN